MTLHTDANIQQLADDFMEKLAADLSPDEKRRMADRLKISGALTAVPYVGVPAHINNVMTTRDAARAKYGDDWKKELKGKPGSFVARHPVASAMIPFTSMASSLKAARELEREARGQAGKSVSKATTKAKAAVRKAKSKATDAGAQVSEAQSKAVAKAQDAKQRAKAKME